MYRRPVRLGYGPEVAKSVASIAHENLLSNQDMRRSIARIAADKATERLWLCWVVDLRFSALRSPGASSPARRRTDFGRGGIVGTRSLRRSSLQCRFDRIGNLLEKNCDRPDLARRMRGGDKAGQRLGLQLRQRRHRRIERRQDHVARFRFRRRRQLRRRAFEDISAAPPASPARQRRPFSLQERPVRLLVP